MSTATGEESAWVATTAPSRGTDDRELLIVFGHRMDPPKSEYTDYRRDKLLRHRTLVAGAVVGLVEALEDLEAAEGLVRWINRNDDTEYTNQDYRAPLWILGGTGHCSD